jgi:phosphatidylglycerol:prolipoprotein diacylglycerol transferase
MVAIAFLVGLWTASRRALREGIAPEKIIDLGPWVIVGAIVGARILYVITFWREEFADKPILDMFMVWRGGLVFYGGLIGASFGFILYARLKKLPLWKGADIMAPSIALGYVFGRIGCLMNGCCYGRVCDLPWAIRFPNQSNAWNQQSAQGLVGPNDPSLPVHPTQLYESLLNLCLYTALVWLYKRKKFDGQIFAIYLVCYAVLRSFVEMFRGDYPQYQRHFGGWLTPAHLVSIAILIAGVVLLLLLPRISPKPQQRT